MKKSKNNKNNKVRVSYFDRGISFRSVIFIERQGRRDAKKGLLKIMDRQLYSEYIRRIMEQTVTSLAVNMKACDDATHHLYVILATKMDELEVARGKRDSANEELKRLRAQHAENKSNRVQGEQELPEVVVQGRRANEARKACAPLQDRLNAKDALISNLLKEIAEIKAEIAGVEDGYFLGNSYLEADYYRHCHAYARGAGLNDGDYYIKFKNDPEMLYIERHAIKIADTDGRLGASHAS